MKTVWTLIVCFFVFFTLISLPSLAMSAHIESDAYLTADESPSYFSVRYTDGKIGTDGKEIWITVEGEGTYQKLPDGRIKFWWDLSFLPAGTYRIFVKAILADPTWGILGESPEFPFSFSRPATGRTLKTPVNMRLLRLP